MICKMNRLALGTTKHIFLVSCAINTKNISSILDVHYDLASFKDLILCNSFYNAIIILQ